MNRLAELIKRVEKKYQEIIYDIFPSTKPNSFLLYILTEDSKKILIINYNKDTYKLNTESLKLLNFYRKEMRKLKQKKPSRYKWYQEVIKFKKAII